MDRSSDAPDADPLASMRVSVERRFAAGAQAVWDLLVDIPLMARWSPEVVTASWVEGSDRTAFTATNRRGDREWTVTCHVLESVPPTTFGWCVSDPGRRSSTWRYELTPDGAGTRVRQEFAHGPGSSLVRQMVGAQGADVAAIVAWRSQMLRDDMAGVLAAADRHLAGR